MSAASDVRDTAQRAEESPVVERVARLGLAARTVVWSTIALLALSLAVSGSGKPDQSGALGTLSQNRFGALLLFLVAAGFLVFALYRALTAAVGHRDQPAGRSRWLHRGKSAFDAVLYLLASASSARFLVGRGQDSEHQTRSVTAQVMRLPGGRLVVGAAGLVIVVVALVMAWQAVREDHADDIHRSALPDRLQRPAVLVGVVGLAGRNVVIALVGAFLVDAAVRFDPRDAKGLDATLQTLAAQPYGTGVLLLAAVLLLAYGLWSVVETVWRPV